MKIKEFFKLMNFNTTSRIELCDVKISLDNRTRLTQHDIVDESITKGLGGKYANMKLNSFTFKNDTLTIYAE